MLGGGVRFNDFFEDLDRFWGKGGRDRMNGFMVGDSTLEIGYCEGYEFTIEQRAWKGVICEEIRTIPFGSSKYLVQPWKKQSGH